MKLMKRIMINHLEQIENYLELREGEELRFVDLAFNDNVKGVNRLLRMIPDGYEPKKLKKFYKATGLKIQVQVKKDCEVVFYDRKGRYPREDAAIWNKDFMKGVGKHPEWLEPQEEADIIIRYTFVDEKEDNDDILPWE